MSITANDPKRKTWLDIPKNTDFPIQNIPFGVFLTRDDIITIGTRIGDFAIDLGALHQLGYFEGIPLKLTKAKELAGHAKDTRMSVCKLISIKENPGGGVKSL